MSKLDFNRDMKINLAIEEGEELLYERYPLSVVTEKKRLLVGVDAGSTQTRVLIIDAADEDVDTQLYNIPSVSSFVPNDVEIRPQGELLYDLMDATIVNKKISSETIFTKERVIRGRKKLDAGRAENRISSTTQKIKTKEFYINIIDAIGYALCQKYKDRIPSSTEIIVGVALPPDDRQSTVNRELFKKQLLGEYTWAHTDSGVKLNIDIAEAAILTEPEAFIKASYIEANEEFPEYILHINGGGRSIGVELLSNGVPIDKTSKSLYYGGTQLAENLGNIIAKTEGGRPAKDNALKKALKTGTLVKGKTVDDILDYIKTVKSEFADRIYSDIIKDVFDAQDQIAIEDVAEISVSGRLFEEGDYKVSIADYLQKKFEKDSPNTEFVRMQGNLIPLGLAYTVYSDYFSFLEEGADELNLNDEENMSDSNVVNYPTNVVVE